METGENSVPPLLVQAAVGHVSVCGVDLRVSACPSGQGREPPVLVKTATVERNLKSLALALCGVRLSVRRARIACAFGRRQTAPPDSKTYLERSSVKIPSRYPYEGARGGSGAELCCRTS